jgi:hypothetical protein
VRPAPATKAATAARKIGDDFCGRACLSLKIDALAHGAT